MRIRHVGEREALPQILWGQSGSVCDLSGFICHCRLVKFKGRTGIDTVLLLGLQFCQLTFDLLIEISGSVQRPAVAAKLRYLVIGELIELRQKTFIGDDFSSGFRYVIAHLLYISSVI
jgi:hypothetical protein